MKLCLQDRIHELNDKPIAEIKYCHDLVIFTLRELLSLPTSPASVADAQSLSLTYFSSVSLSLLFLSKSQIWYLELLNPRTDWN
jgi:hypothetical protein